MLVRLSLSTVKHVPFDKISNRKWLYTVATCLGANSVSDSTESNTAIECSSAASSLLLLSIEEAIKHTKARLQFGEPQRDKDIFLRKKPVLRLKWNCLDRTITFGSLQTWQFYQSPPQSGTELKQITYACGSIPKPFDLCVIQLKGNATTRVGYGYEFLILKAVAF